jgi:hypothetical protein
MSILIYDLLILSFKKANVSNVPQTFSFFYHKIEHLGHQDEKIRGEWTTLPNPTFNTKWISIPSIKAYNDFNLVKR